MERRQDIFLGLLFAGIGGVIAILAPSYSGASGLYPLVLGALMASIGVIIAIKAFISGNQTIRVLAPAPGKLLLSGLACIVYISLVVPLGFYSASLLLMLLLPVLLGFRQPIFLCLMAAGFMGLIYVLFSVVLEKPLPAEFWSITRMGAM
jgi:hypothetical protein